MNEKTRAASKISPLRAARERVNAEQWLGQADAREPQWACRFIDPGDHRWREIADAREAQERRAEPKYYWQPVSQKGKRTLLAAMIICTISALFLLYAASCAGTMCT